MFWTPYALPWLIVAAALLLLAGVIFSRQRASRVAVFFCLMIVLVAVWFAAFAMMFLSRDADVAVRWGRLGLAGVALLPAAIYDFTITALRLYSKRQYVVRVVWVIGGVFAILAAITGLVASGVAPHAWGFYPIAGPLLGVFLLFFFAALLAQLADGVGEYRRTSDPKRRRRIGRMMIAFAVVYLAAIDFIPMFNPRLRPIGYIPVLAFIAVAWTAILRH